jgi:hypothetical protein
MIGAHTDDVRLSYFPSYEVALRCFKQPFMEERRHVHKHVLDFNMAVFERYFCCTGLTDGDLRSRFSIARDLDQAVVDGGHWAVPRIHVPHHEAPGS